MRKRLIDVRLGDTFLTTYALEWQTIDGGFVGVGRHELIVVINICDKEVQLCNEEIRCLTFLTSDCQLLQLSQRFNLLPEDLLPALLQVVA